ncbi:MAG: M24 family metallopeptidase [Candidatus Thorarchaeota archaeon]
MTIPLMEMVEKLKILRNFMETSELDAWLIIDFRGIDPTGEALLGQLTPRSRLYAIIISLQDTITIVKSPVEGTELINLTPLIQTYDARTQAKFIQVLKTQLKGFNRVAANFSENPQTDVLPTGRFKLLRDTIQNVQWASGENLMQIIHSVLSTNQMASHERAAKTLTNIMKQAFAYIKDHMGLITEEQVAGFIVNKLSEANLTFTERPMVAIQSNAANPHYTAGNTLIEKDRLLMIDLWAKWKIFADITWMAYTGSHIPDSIQTVWDTIIEARKAATAAIKPFLPARIPDERAREIMISAGYEQAILHRTGHSIDSHSHGKGANLDSYEMPETRLLLPNTVVSVEPGIYLKGKFGVRSEINVAITKSAYRITTPPQENLLCL